MEPVSIGSSAAGEERSSGLLTVCGGTDIGSQRPQNQDTFVIADLQSGSVSRPCISTDVSVSRPGLLLLVCDGMGGAAAGDVAANVAAATIKHDLERAGAAVMRAPGASLNHAILGANQAILEEAKVHPEERGMGTTCTAAIVSPGRLTIAQVGDSRAYLLRDGKLRVLTRDQTLASELGGSGALTAEETARSPFRHILAQAVGIQADVKPVATEEEFREGDRLLLCSDGLYEPVSDKQIAEILNRTPNPCLAAKALIAAALAGGGPDNVTVVVANCGLPRSRTTLH